MAILGVLPAVGSGLTTMAATGQLGRLLVYIRAWDAAFGHATYFSYLDRATEKAHIRHLQQTGRHWAVNTWGGRWTPFRALLRPLGQPAHWRGLSVCRALNLLGAVPALTAKWAYGVPFVVSHGADYEAIARIHGRSARHLRKWGWLRRVVFGQAAAVLVSNERLAARFQDQFPHAHIIRHPNWVDTELFCPDPATKPEPGRVLFVGRVVEEKNLLRLAEAVGGLWAARLRVVGEGPLDWALGHGHPCVDVAGPVAWERLPAEHRAARCFVLPSLTEGHPKALIEAMASGMAVAVSDRVEGCVRHEKTGLVFAAEDVHDMRQQIQRLLEDDALAARLGAAARAEALARWDARQLMPREITLMREVARS